MRILIFGKNGQVGWELQRALLLAGEVIALGYPEIDLIDSKSICDSIREVRPNLVINAAAYTDVDGAESEVEKSSAINGTAPGVIAEEARAVGAAIVHYSTDYVFDGEKKSPYDEQDTPNPINYYGKSKLLGERAIQEIGGAYIILRTSWVYSFRTDNFLTRVLSWSRSQNTLSIVDDQTGSPTSARFLAEATALFLGSGGENIYRYIRDRRGIYHVASSGSPSRFDWAKQILAIDPDKAEQICEKIVPAKSTDFPLAALRPSNSALDSNRFFEMIGSWPLDWTVVLSHMMIKSDCSNNQSPPSPTRSLNRGE